MENSQIKKKVLREHNNVRTSSTSLKKNEMKQLFPAVIYIYFKLSGNKL